ncbi:chemotaxis response regulator protein-glutamate methylesterase [Desulfobacterales bacterium HSG16]|nr:chemotaxis response regulator protein-glutamate methylesterase [Desulfobacterales bacterium HSG16]
MSKIKVLIVDDSRIFRSALEKSLEGIDHVEIIGSVFNGTKALEFIRRKRPDIVTLDVEMPGMDGLSVLNAIRKINSTTPDTPPVGVIMISSFTEHGADVTIKALEAGAFDFITKPEAKNSEAGIEIIRNQLLPKLRQYTGKKAKPSSMKICSVPITPQRSTQTDSPSSIQAILIGSSTGGPRALGEILPALCEKIDIPILVVQHMPPKFTDSLARSLDKKCLYTVVEGKHGKIINPKFVYIAPGGSHMLVRRFDKETGLIMNQQPPENGCRPSINIFFRSAAAVYGRNVIGIVLTGMGADGKIGVKSLKRAGAHIIVQDESSSVVWGMPRSAIDSGCVDEIVPLSNIADTIISYMNRDKGCG